jgi:pyochelin synthetase
VAGGLLGHEPDAGRYHGLVTVDDEELERHWSRLDALGAGLGWAPELLRYMRTCAGRLPELLADELDPLALLFPGARLETAEAAYRDNPLSRYLNRAAAAGLRHIAAAHPPHGPLRVLEVGAGVGGTSQDLIEELATLPAGQVDYLFTDVSRFFLNEARERYAEHSWVRYGLFDLNVDIRAQGLAPHSFDVIVCANVLHNARDAGEVLGRLGELLCPGGWLVFVETTRESYPLMLSMEFISGLTGFTDARQDSGATFLGREQWLELLASSGAQVPLCFPAASDPLSAAGQHVFFARLKTDRIPVTTGQLREHAASLLPEYMVPTHLELLDALPLTANGKVDRAALRGWLPEEAGTAGGPGGAEPRDELESRLAGLWAELLGRERVGRDEDFFALGGDSLLVARLVGHLRDREPAAQALGWEPLLRQVLAAPTVAALAAALREVESTLTASEGAGASSAGGGTAPQEATATTAGTRVSGGAGSPLVVLRDGPADQPARVLVHDGTGTLLPYQSLVEELGRAPADGPLLGLELADVEAYLALDENTLVARLAEDYAATLLATGARRFHVVGYCLGGLLATEVAGVLAESGASVESLTVISSYRPPFQVDDELLIEYVYALLSGVDPATVGYPDDEQLLGAAIRAVLEETPGRLPQGCFAALDGDLAAVGERFRALSGRSRAERLAVIGRRAPGVDPAPAGPTMTDPAPAGFRVFRHSLRAVTRHQAGLYAGDMTFLRHDGEVLMLPGLREDMADYWRRVCLGELRVRDIPGDHFGCLSAPHAAGVCDLLPGVSP